MNDKGLLITSDQLDFLNDTIRSTGNIENGEHLEILANIREIYNFNDNFMEIINMLDSDIKSHLKKDKTYSFLAKYNESNITLIFESNNNNFINKFNSIEEIIEQDVEWKSLQLIQEFGMSHKIEGTLWKNGLVYRTTSKGIKYMDLGTQSKTVRLMIHMKIDKNDEIVNVK